MCGLVGIISSTPLAQVQINQFKKLLVMDQVRGKDSVGIISEKTDGIFFEKNTIDPVSFLEHRRVTPLLTSTRALIGHNRAATRGGVTVNNAHPFNHGAVTLVHNGTLFSNAVTTPHFTVDSESICYALSQVEPEQASTVLESLSGAYALIWRDERDDSWNVARNDERPLNFMRNTTGNILWISSEPGILYAAVAEDMDVEPSKHIFSVPAGSHYKLTVDKTELVQEVTKFTPKKQVASHYPSTLTTGQRSTTNRTHQYNGAFELAKANFERLIGKAGWYQVEVDSVVRNNAVGTHLFTVTGWMNVDPFCKVIINNVPANSVSVGDTIEVHLQTLYTDRNNNWKAYTDPSEATLFGVDFRRGKAGKQPAPKGEAVNEAADEENFEDDCDMCICCGGVFLTLSEMAMLTNGEYVCKKCYDEDTFNQRYVDSIGIERGFKK